MVGHLLFFESEEALVSSSPGMAARSERLICAVAVREGGGVRFWSGDGGAEGSREIDRPHADTRPLDGATGPRSEPG